MKMTGEYLVPAPRDHVWAALNDVAILKAAIPGCQSLVATTDHQFEASITAKVGPVKANFTGLATLSDLDPPNSYTISGEGKGGVAGFARGGAQIRLTDAPAGTLLSYTVSAAVGGKLAQLGSRLIDSTARKLANEFFLAFSAAAAAKDDSAAPSSAELATPAGSRDHDAPAGSGALSLGIWVAVAVILAAVLVLVIR